ERVNYGQKEALPRRVIEHFREDLSGKTFAVWGLSVNPNTDDMREASSRGLMERLWAAGARVQAFDPDAMPAVAHNYRHRPQRQLCRTREEALEGADALVICTEWKAFRAPDFDIVKRELKNPVIFDGRNLYEPRKLKKLGFTYYAIGRGDSVQNFRTEL